MTIDLLDSKIERSDMRMIRWMCGVASQVSTNKNFDGTRRCRLRRHGHRTQGDANRVKICSKLVAARTALCRQAKEDLVEHCLCGLASAGSGPSGCPGVCCKMEGRQTA